MKKKRELILSCIAIAVILIMVITMTAAASFSVLVADDFSHGMGVGAFHVSFPEYLKASAAYARSIYLNWQGTYFSMFVQALLSPINHYGFEQLRWVMVLNSLLFYAALSVLTLCVFQNIGKEKYSVKFWILAILVFCFCGYQSYPEVFFWYSGATSYSIPLSLLFFALALFWKTAEKKSIGMCIASALLGIMAMGGSLAVSGTGCFLSFLFCLYLFLSEKKIPLRHGIIFLTWLAAAGIHALAPGNYARHSVIDQSGIHPGKALYDAVNMASIRWNTFFRSTDLVFLLLVVMLLGFWTGERKADDPNRKYRILVSALALLTPVVTAFPIALGYSSETMPNRCAFLIDVSIILSAIHLAFILGKEVPAQVEAEQKKFF